MSTVASSSAGPSTQKQHLTYEFTKRKRWADLLVTELADAIIIILSSTCKVLYCGAAVTELLGWRDEELVDGDLVDLMNVDDQHDFRTSFEESVRMNNEMLSYVRLKCKNHIQATSDYQTSPKEILFELKGHPHFVHDEEAHDFKCFFAMAKPYPSRNTAMLNTFLELKMENERLQQRLVDLKARAPKGVAPSHYSTSSMPPPRNLLTPLTVPSQRSSEPSNPYYPINSSLVRSGYDDILPSPVRSSFDGSGGLSSYGASGLYGSGSVPTNSEDDSEDGARKKKMKKAHLSEQYVCVTCGRTDSPEWRKGPLGPKTLCNACGLRWAKQMRKFDDSNEGNGENTSAPALA